MIPLDFSQVRTYPLSQRKNLVGLNDLYDVDTPPPPFDKPEFDEVIARIVAARRDGRPVIWMMGAHVIKCGLSRLIIDLIQRGIVTHIAGNGAVSIHDFELALIGETSEDVATSLEDGTFGMADETGRLMNRAIQAGVRAQIGYGASIGRFMAENAALFPYRDLSVLYQSHRQGVPATIHVTIGTDIIHQHPSADFAALGAASGLDFRLFATSVSQLEGGVFLNFGSAVTGPEVFLKALTIVRNLGHTVSKITTANFDLLSLGDDYHGRVGQDAQLYYYRPRKNIVNRPTSLGGKGFHITGDHTVTIPNLYHRVVQRLDRIGGPSPSQPVVRHSQSHLSASRLHDILASSAHQRIGVIGDVALDAYWYADMARSSLSRETPHYPHPVIRETYSLGAGANVASNLKALGTGQVIVFSVVGDDWRGLVLSQEMTKQGIAVDGLIISPPRSTAAYIKPILTGYDSQQEDARLDFENEQPLFNEQEEALIAKVRHWLPDLDALLVIDQLSVNGIISSRVRDALNTMAGDYPDKVFIVDSRQNIGLFRNMILKPNTMEASLAIHPDRDPGTVRDDDLVEIGRLLCAQSHRAAYITLDKKGVLVCNAETCEHLPAAPVHPPLDVVGAGDSFIAALAVALVAQTTPREAGTIACLAAAVVVEKLNQTGTASPQEIIARYELAQGILP
jgi:rfaE bifunctional protein kinase chain/domain